MSNAAAAGPGATLRYGAGIYPPSRKDEGRYARWRVFSAQLSYSTAGIIVGSLNPLRSAGPLFSAFRLRKPMPTRRTLTTFAVAAIVLAAGGIAVYGRIQSADAASGE